MSRRTRRRNGAHPHNRKLRLSRSGCNTAGSNSEASSARLQSGRRAPLPAVDASPTPFCGRRTRVAPQKRRRGIRTRRHPNTSAAPQRLVAHRHAWLAPSQMGPGWAPTPSPVVGLVNAPPTAQRGEARRSPGAAALAPRINRHRRRLEKPSKVVFAV